MERIVLKFITLSFFFTIIFTSCSKEADVMTRNTELLVKAPWKFERHGLDGNNDGLLEESENSMLACETDDVYTFYPTCTGIYSAGTTACGVEEPTTINFDWRLLNNGTQLGIFGAAEMINRLDENILEVYYMDEDTLGQPVKYIRRFRHW